MEDVQVQAESSAPTVSIEEFVTLLGQKPQFQAQLVDQTKKDIDILSQLGMTKREIRAAVGLSENHGPRTKKAPAVAKKAAAKV